jgi:hypothetical protein
MKVFGASGFVAFMTIKKRLHVLDEARFLF